MQWIMSLNWFLLLDIRIFLKSATSVRRSDYLGFEPCPDIRCGAVNFTWRT